MLLLSTSMAMAQFGDLEEIIRKAESGNSGNGSTDTPSGTERPSRSGSGAALSLIEAAVKDGFYLVKQEYRLEDVNVPGSRYNREGSDCFGSKVSFMLKLKNGIVTSNEIMAPWENDENFEEYKGGQYVPHISRTSYLYAGKKEWKVADKMLDPDDMDSDDIKKDKGMAYITNDETSEGFSIATSNGKKDAFVIWLNYRSGKDEVSASYSINNVEVNIEKGKTQCKVPLKSKPNADFGIVVIPTYSIGRVELALLGVIDLTYNKISEEDAEKDFCKMELLRSLVDEVESSEDDDNSGHSGLESSEETSED